MQVNNIICKDILQFIKDVDNDFFDITVTSPPYQDIRKYGGIRWDMEIFKSVANQLFRTTKEGGAVA